MHNASDCKVTAYFKRGFLQPDYLIRASHMTTIRVRNVRIVCFDSGVTQDVVSVSTILQVGSDANAIFFVVKVRSYYTAIASQCRYIDYFLPQVTAASPHVKLE